MSPTSSAKPKHKLTNIWAILKATYNEWSSDKATTLAASITYYTIFSLGPLLMIAVFLSGLIFGQKAASDQLRPQLTNVVGEKAAEFLQQMIAKAGFSPAFSIAGIISMLLLIYAATNIFINLQDALNTIFDVKPKPGRGIMAIVKDRALSFLMVLFIGAMLLASIIASTVLAAVTKNISLGNPTLTAFLFQFLNFALTAAIFTLLFAILFKYLPDIKIPWRDTWIGAAFTAVLFSIARIGLGYYLARSSTAGPFGAAGSLVIVMLFIYYSAQIFFLGAEFTQVYARRAGDPIKPAPIATSLDPDCSKFFKANPQKNQSAADHKQSTPKRPPLFNFQYSRASKPKRVYFPSLTAQNHQPLTTRSSTPLPLATHPRPTSFSQS